MNRDGTSCGLFGWFHTWDKWKTIEVGVLQETYDRLTGEPRRSDGQPATIGFFERQRRECVKCGKAQLRQATT